MSQFQELSQQPHSVHLHQHHELQQQLQPSQHDQVPQMEQQFAPYGLQSGTRHELHFRIRRWVVTLLSGFGAAVMAYLINLGIEGIDKLRFMGTMPLIHPGGGLFLPWLVYTVSSCAPALLAGLGVAYLSPLAAGSGIPHIKAYCNGVDIHGLLTLKTLLVKALGAMCSIGSGIIAGKEGPFIQCGACIAWLLENASHRLFGGEAVESEHTGKTGDSTTARPFYQPAQGASKAPNPQPILPLHQQPEELSHRTADQLSSGINASLEQCARAERSSCQGETAAVQSSSGNQTANQQGQWQRHWQQQQLWRLWRRQQHDAAAMGAGAGVAAAFVAPLAGAAYAVEEAATQFSTNMLGMAFFAGGLVVLFLWIFSTATAFGGNSLSWMSFSSPLSLAFRGTTGTDLRFWWYVWELPLIVLLGVLGAVLSALWTFLNTHLLTLRKTWLKHPLRKVADVVLICFVTNTLRIVVAHQSPCSPQPSTLDLDALQEQLTSWRFFGAPTGLYPQLWCPAGQYSVYGQLFMMPAEVVVRSLFTLQPRGSLSVNLSQHSNQTHLMLSSATTAAGSNIASPADDEAASYVFRTDALAAYMAYVWGMLLISYGIAAPTGIFIPALAIGATGGRLTGQLLRQVIRAAGVQVPICLPGWSVLGATAMLVGITRLTLANALIVLESSGAVPMSVPMVLLTIPVKLLSDCLFKGIYDWQIADAGYAFVDAVDALSSSERAAMTHYQVRDLLGLKAFGSVGDARQDYNTSLPQRHEQQQKQQQPQACTVSSIRQPKTEGFVSFGLTLQNSTQSETPDGTPAAAAAAAADIDNSSCARLQNSQLPNETLTLPQHRHTHLPAAADGGPQAQQEQPQALWQQQQQQRCSSVGVFLSPDAGMDIACNIFRELSLQELPVVAWLPPVNLSGAEGVERVTTARHAVNSSQAENGRDDYGSSSSLGTAYLSCGRSSSHSGSIHDDSVEGSSICKGGRVRAATAAAAAAADMCAAHAPAGAAPGSTSVACVDTSQQQHLLQEHQRVQRSRPPMSWTLLTRRDVMPETVLTAIRSRYPDAKKEQ